MTAICLCRNCYDRGNVTFDTLMGRMPTMWACPTCTLIQRVADTMLYIWKG